MLGRDFLIVHSLFAFGFVYTGSLRCQLSRAACQSMRGILRDAAMGKRNAVFNKFLEVSGSGLPQRWAQNISLLPF